MTETPPTTLTLLDYLLDEVRSTSSLLRVADLARTVRRPWWRSAVMGLIRTPTEVSSDLGVQYLGQNLDRSRDHWRRALVHCDELRQMDPTNEVVVRLLRQLDDAGLHDVLAQLQQDAVPPPVAEAAAHLAVVVDKIRACDALVIAARNKMMLQRMRDESAS